jgi:SAM-dependent methyltransferase
LLLKFFRLYGIASKFRTAFDKIVNLSFLKERGITIFMHDIAKIDNMNLNIGPGENWTKPSSNWITVDVDPRRGDIVLNFQKFKGFPLKGNTCNVIYASHVFEHIIVYSTQFVFNECFRVLKKEGYLRIIVPDVVKSMHEYLTDNQNFKLFVRRRERAKRLYGEDYTLFECLREDFISRSIQSTLGKNALAHQNAFDFDTMQKHLIIAGFKKENIYKSGFQQSKCLLLSWEGQYISEANEDYRSLYVECKK